MIVGSLRLDLLLFDVHSLKTKRSVLSPVLAEIRRVHPVSAAQTGAHELLRRAEIGVAVVGTDAAWCTEVLRACDERVSARPEFDVLSSRLRLWDDEDE